MTQVFVYGTLMPGQPRWPSLERYAAEWCDANAAGHLWDTGRGYPAAVFDADGTTRSLIPGVCVALHPASVGDAVAALDAIEGEGVLYRRVTVETSAGPALSYEWMGDTTGFIALPDGWLRGA